MSLDLRFHAELQRRAAELVDTKKDDLAAGTHRDFAEVRHAVGYLQGIKEMLDEAENIRKTMFEG